MITDKWEGRAQGPVEIHTKEGPQPLKDEKVLGWHRADDTSPEIVD